MRLAGRVLWLVKICFGIGSVWEWNGMEWDYLSPSMMPSLHLPFSFYYFI